MEQTELKNEQSAENVFAKGCIEQPSVLEKSTESDNCPNNQITYKKEELNNKLSDSACGSLNESEDSGSKCQEIEFESNESDSLVCDDEDDLGESEEEDESVANNTFNVINTENSESQEISELTNDDSSICDRTKENGAQASDISRQTDENNSDLVNPCTESNSDSDKPSPNSEEVYEDNDVSEDSAKFTREDDCPDLDVLLDEDVSISKLGGGASMEVSPESIEVSESPNKEEDASMQSPNIETQSTNTTTAVNAIKEIKTNSPKIKKKLGPFPNIPQNDAFKIEIFESKRKPDASTIIDNINPSEQKQNNLETKPIINSEPCDKIATPILKIENEVEKVLESPQNSDKIASSEPSSSTPDLVSPDSGDKTNSILLDVSQVIKEESEESDALSPIRSSIEEVQTLESPTDLQDTSRKPQQSENKSQTADPSTKAKPSSNNTREPSTTKPQSTTTDNSTTNHKNNTPELKTPSPKIPDHKNDCGYIEPTAPSPSETQKPTPMAFTVDLDSTASDSSTSGNSGKKLDITASISQWAPKHRRNLSLTKVEENKKLEERQGSEKPPLGRPRSGTVGASCLGTKKGTAGYHSEGYFSSDQDEEGPKKNDIKSPRTPETQVDLERLNSQDSSKNNSIRMRPPSPLSPTGPYGTPLNESASFLIEKMMNATPETKRKLSTKPEGRTCCKERERKPSVSEISGKSYKIEKKMGSDSKKQLQNAPTEEFDPSKDDKDDVSEAGTYTIDKDSPSPEEDQARNDINDVFGVPAPTESEGEICSTTTAVPMSTTDQCLEDESSWLSASEMPPTLSRNSPNWIQQWAAHVAEQTKPPIDPMCPISKASVMSPRGHKLPVSPPDGNDPRPRRKLPTPPAYLSSPPCGMSQRSDPSTSGKHRFWEDRIVSSDIQTSDTEAYLRDTENLVTSLQARVDKTKGNSNPAFRHNNHNASVSFESHESGADSDFDTCNSFSFNEDERMSAALKSKLRLTGLLPASKNSGGSPSTGVTSPRRSDGIISSPRRPESGPGKEGPKMKAYEAYNNSPRRDDRGLQSDSSSEASEPYKEVTRQSDNNPPLKFNRAFSLRRARLGCDDPVSTASDKKKQLRPSSAGAASGASRRTPALGSSSKSYHSVDNPSVSSPRGHGYGVPSSTTTRGLASPSQGGCRATSQTDNFDRSDGGRYSLRLPRTGPAIGIQKSPSKSSIKKDSKKNAAGRSNSTLSSKEVDFQNWKRRKNYDPMKAAAEGRKKQVDKKIKNAQQMSTSQTNSDHRSPSPPGSLLRSASFHGTEGVMANARWSRKPNNRHQYTSEDDGPYSLEDEMGPHPSPMHGSPLHRSPTSPHQLCQSPVRQPPSIPRGRRPSLGHTDEGDQHYQASLRKISMDESGSEGKRSPLNTGNRACPGNPGGAGSGRPKTKMEALDNLVISTIHSLSVKVRTTSESLLQKLKSQYDEEGDRAALLEEVLSHLSESDQSLASGQTRSTSRELAGILRNLKKIEHALEVIDRVIIVGEEDYADDDVDYVPTEWVDESDY